MPNLVIPVLRKLQQKVKYKYEYEEEYEVWMVWQNEGYHITVPWNG